MLSVVTLWMIYTSKNKHSNFQPSMFRYYVSFREASCEAFGKLTAKPQPLWFSPLAALSHLPLPGRTLHINPVDFETGSLTKQSFYSTNNSKLRSTNVFSSEAPFPSSPPAKQLHFPSFWTSEIRRKAIHMSVPIQLPSYGG